MMIVNVIPWNWARGGQVGGRVGAYWTKTLFGWEDMWVSCRIVGYDVIFGRV